MTSPETCRKSARLLKGSGTEEGYDNISNSIGGDNTLLEKIKSHKQELTRILDRQDAHVRLLFQLEKFVSLVYYDPMEAKNDHSNVFEEFRQPYDLWSKVSDDKHGGTTRSTRRQIRNQQHVIETAKKREDSVKQEEDLIADSPVSLSGRKSARLSSVKKSSSSTTPVKSRLTRASNTKKIKTSSQVSSKKSNLKSKSQTKTQPKNKRRQVLTSSENENDSSEEEDDDDDNDLPPESTLLDEPDGLDFDIDSSDLDSPDEDVVIPKLKLKFSIPAQTVSHPSHYVRTPPNSTGDNTLTSSQSIEKYLSSFISLDEDITKEDQIQFIEDQIQSRRRVADARRRGLLLEDFATSSEKLPAFKDPIKANFATHNDHMVSQAVYFSKLMSDERKQHLSTARKIANMIDLYFKRLSGAEERQRKSQERLIRQLARRTANEVFKKWKLAEKVVFQRRAQALEEQQRARGKLQLNNILEHSAQLLEARRHGRDSDDDDDDDDDINNDNDELSEQESIENVNRDDESSNEERYYKKDVIESGDINRSLNDETSSSADSEVMSSSEDESDVSDNNLSLQSKDRDDENLTIDELKIKYSNLSSLENDNIKEIQVAGKENYIGNHHSTSLASLYTNIKNNDQDSDLMSTSDQSITMDSEDDDFTSDSDSSHEISKESQVQGEEDNEKQLKNENGHRHQSTLSSLFNGPIDDSDSDESVKSACSSNSEPEGSTTSVSSPEIHKTEVPFLLRGTLREYQHDGLDWLVGLYNNSTNGILADEMGLGKTIQTISLLAYLACIKEVWGPHLIVVPTSVMLNWEMEFKRFAPGFKVLTYYGNPHQRKEKRRGWNKEDTWHVCITSYQLVLQDHNAFRRKRWHYMILDEAHNIKNFRSQRWQALLNFNSERRLLLTGTPLQNNLIELWSLLYFLMPSSKQNMLADGFANLKDFQDWFARPVDKLVEGGGVADDEARQTVNKLHQVLRPYLLRRLKADVEKQMPAKYEHVVYCRLSKRQRYLYDDFMSRAQTRETLASGNFLSIINCLMQLRKVCNHPDLFEVRPIVTSMALSNSICSSYKDKAEIMQKLFHKQDQDQKVDLSVLNLLNLDSISMTTHSYCTIHRIQGTKKLADKLSELVPYLAPIERNYDSIEAHTRYKQYRRKWEEAEKLQHQTYLNAFRCSKKPIYGRNVIEAVSLGFPQEKGFDWNDLKVLKTLKLSTMAQEEKMVDIIDKYSFVTPKVVCLDMPRLLLGDELTHSDSINALRQSTLFHQSQVKLTIAFPDKRLLQYDCGKLQRMAILLRDLIDNGHRVLIFTQMTKVLDILEQFLNIHGWRYLRLDGATKVEQRQALTEQFNADNRVPVFILSTRSGGLGINLTGADTVIFYDSDWNPSMDKQCQDRCHRIGQTRDVHIYRFVSEYTIESNILKKATQKQILDNVVIQEGEFTTDYFNKITVKDMIGDVAPDISISNNTLGSKNFERALRHAEDVDDVAAANAALKEVNVDREDFVEGESTSQAPDSDRNTSRAVSASIGTESTVISRATSEVPSEMGISSSALSGPEDDGKREDSIEEEVDEESNEEVEDDDIGSVDDYMIRFIEKGYFES